MELPEMQTGFQDLNLFKRDRTEPFHRELGLALYNSGLSLRKVSTVLEWLGTPRSHVAVWNWINKAGEEVRGSSQNNLELPDTIVMDETVVKQNGEQMWVYAALNPETRALLHINVYVTRNELTTRAFLNEIQDRYGTPPDTVITDNASWYGNAFHRLGVERVNQHHGPRNRVERWFQELKRRIQSFYNHFNGDSLQTTQNWLSQFMQFWNEVLLS